MGTIPRVKVKKTGKASLHGGGPPGKLRTTDERAKIRNLSSRTRTTTLKSGKSLKMTDMAPGLFSDPKMVIRKLPKATVRDSNKIVGSPKPPLPKVAQSKARKRNAAELAKVRARGKKK